MSTPSKILSIICGILLNQRTEAFPFGAGSCRSGAGVGGSHILDNNGTLATGNAQFTVNGKTLNEGDVITLYSNATNELKIIGGFKGFLLKVSGNPDELGDIPDAYGTLSLIDDENSQMLPRTSDSVAQNACLDNESGMSHTSNNVKESIASNFMYEGLGNFTLEVTVVNGNDGTDNDGWFYSPFQVVVEKSSSDETASETGDVEENPETGVTSGDVAKTPESSASSLVVGNIVLFGIGLLLLSI